MADQVDQDTWATGTSTLLLGSSLRGGGRPGGVEDLDDGLCHLSETCDQTSENGVGDDDQLMGEGRSHRQPLWVHLA